MAKETRKPRVMTKKHLARVERERLQRRWIIIITGIVVVVAVGLTIAGIFGGRIMEALVYPRQPVAIVNGDKILTPYFQDRTRYARLGLVEQAYQAAQLIQLFQDSPDFQQYYQSNLQQIAMQLDPNNMGQQVLDMLVEETLIRQEAKRRGITVTSEEIEKALQENYGYFANGTPTPTATRPVSIPATLSAAQLALVTATPTITPTMKVTPTITPTLEFTLTPSPTIQFTSTPTQIPSQTPTQGPTATPTPFTFEAYQTTFKQQLEALKEIGYTEEKLRGIVEISLLRQKVMDVIEADLTQEQDQEWIRHILVADETTANQVLDRLNKGEDFGALAAELSTDQTTKSTGGDLDRFYQSQLEQRFGKAVAEAAFNLHQVGEISKPVQGSDGWHIIQLVSREKRRMTTNEFEQFRIQKFREWILAQRDASDVQIFDYWTDRVPTEPTLDPNLLQSGTP